MVSFILNNKLIKTNKPVGMTLLDFIRYESGLKGTKIGCREGDCGACTVICGKLANNIVKYKTIVSCLTPLGNLHGKHIVSIEGLNQEQLSPVQQALVDHNGTQCGFCTPGFVVSLTEFLLSTQHSSLESAIEAIDGNICRCTGYKSIERAAAELVKIKKKIAISNPISSLINNNFLPEYFSLIKTQLQEIKDGPDQTESSKIIIGGGTDLYVQKPDDLIGMDLEYTLNIQDKEAIQLQNDNCLINGNATATDIMESRVMLAHFPQLKKHFKLISSTPVRNMGTLAGNIVNASPIGDLSIFFLALNADLTLMNKGNQERKIKLKDFFLDYKQFDLQKNELVKSIECKLPAKTDRFNFEKVCKRTFLDIASVNTAIKCKVEHNKIIEVYLSAGGVSSVPLYLKKASEFLKGKEINISTVLEVNEIAQKEISPISDIRGSAEYKRLLLRQLIFAHFIELFPEKISVKEL